MNSEISVVVDIECFRYRNQEWVVKEIAVSGDYIDSISLQEPYPFDKLPPHTQKAFTWLSNNLHGMPWSSGQYPYKRLDLFVQSVKLRYPNSLFFAKGFEKCVFLKSLFENEFHDLDDLGCPRIDQLKYKGVPCMIYTKAHSLSSHCARKKVDVFGVWLRNYLFDNGELEGSVSERFNNLTFND